MVNEHCSLSSDEEDAPRSLLCIICCKLMKGDDRCPMTLGCGYILCRQYLREVVERTNKCPECREEMAHTAKWAQIILAVDAYLERRRREGNCHLISRRLQNHMKLILPIRTWSESDSDVMKSILPQIVLAVLVVGSH
jgi:hypothetical protein